MTSGTKTMNKINKLIVGQGLRTRFQDWKTGSEGLSQESRRAEG